MDAFFNLRSMHQNDTAPGCPQPDPVDANLDLTNAALAFLFIAFNALLSAILQLDLSFSYIIAASRCALQLFLLGKVLRPVLDAGANPLFSLSLAALLVLISAIEIAANRSKLAFRGLFPTVLVAIAVPTLLTAFVGIRFALGAETWFEARRFIPMLGMLLGNSMSAVAVTLSTALNTLTKAKESIEFRLAFGASRFEIARQVARDSIKLGLLPTLNSMSVTGLVAIPGMMTGQILGGASVQTAVVYQIIILYMISASAAASCVIAIGVCLMVCLDSAHRLRLDRVSERKGISVGLKAAGDWLWRLVTCGSRKPNEADGIGQAGEQRRLLSGSNR